MRRPWPTGEGRGIDTMVNCCTRCNFQYMLILLTADGLLAETHTHIYKDKAVPLQAWSGPEGSRKLRFPDFMTTLFPPGNAPGTHFC